MRDIATALARKEAAAGLTGKRPNVYQALFGALYRQFGCTSYKLIRADQYAQVIEWLREYQQAHDARCNNIVSPCPGQHVRSNASPTTLLLHPTARRSTILPGWT